MGRAAIVVDLPMRGVDVSECRAGAIADEQQPIPRKRAVAAEISDDIAVRFPPLKDECIVPGAAHEYVGSAAASQQIDAGIAVDSVHPAVTVTLQVAATLHDQGFHIFRQSEMSGRVD